MLFAVVGYVASFFRLGLSHLSDYFRYTLSGKYIDKHVEEMRLLLCTVE